MLLENRFQRSICFAALLGMTGVAVHSLVDFGLHLLVNAFVFLVLVNVSDEEASMSEVKRLRREINSKHRVADGIRQSPLCLCSKPLLIFCRRTLRVGRISRGKTSWAVRRLSLKTRPCS